jgi:hypothetical protein
MVIIKYVNEDTVAFELNGEIWYLRIGPGIPSLYDNCGRKQVVPNLDSWFQSKTGHRHSYQSICDMATAFATAIHYSYRVEDIVGICVAACRTTVSEIFKTDFANDYRRLFWVEFLDPARLPTQAKTIRNNFDTLRDKLGDDNFYNYLCRLWKVCHYQDPSEAAVFEKLIKRMGKYPVDPSYPDSKELDDKLCRHIIGKLLRKDMPQFPNLPKEIIKNADDIQAGRL